MIVLPVKKNFMSCCRKSMGKGDQKNLFLEGALVIFLYVKRLLARLYGLLCKQFVFVANAVR